MLVPEELYLINTQWCNGVAPGYWPTAEPASLVLDISAGTSFIGNTRFVYAGGTLTMTNNATNYVFLDTTASNVPAKNTTGYPSTGIPIATVTTVSGAITAIQDDRTLFNFQTSTSTKPYAISLDTGDGTVPTASQSLGRHIISGDLATVLFASGLPTSGFKARIGSTGTYVVTIKRYVSGSPTSIGTITYTSASLVGTISFTGAVTCNPTDEIEFVGQSTPDATLSGIYGTMSGTRT